jgi:copper chaperone
MTQQRFIVEGMTCAHCVRAVTAEVSRVPGVCEVHVDLATKTLTFDADAIDEVAVREAVEAAGYTLADAVR